MCGIAALFAYRDDAPPLRREEVERITDSMIERGPDARGTWYSPDGRVGLGSRRLAIIDLSDEGIQPMHDVERELVIVFNGEIYNYRELRASLERGGARFHSRSDTEVLLQLYRRDGERMLGLLRGMYGFVIWDTRTRRLFVARDPYGIKPLYIADDGRTLRIASQVKALLAGGAVAPTRDVAGAAAFFLLGSVPEPFTFHANIRAIEAGSSFFIDANGRGPTHPHTTIASVFCRAEDQQSLGQLAEPEILVREQVTESVEHHLIADVPVGIFLSAGIDSTTIAGIATRLSRTPPRAFTLTFDDLHGATDEAPLAERFARGIGAPHTTRRVTRDEFLADLPRLFTSMDQPTIDGVNTWFISKAVAEAKVKIALTGLGGDELFGGYPSFSNVPRLVRLMQLPLATSLIRRAPVGHAKLRRLGVLGTGWAGAWLLQRGLFMPDELPSLLGKQEAEEGLERLGIVDHVARVLDPDPASAFGRVATLESSLYMRNQLLRDSDWASMAHSVEVRTPLVDVALLRQAAPVTIEHGRRCKQALGADLPPWLRDRPKTAFFVPLGAWLDLPPDGTERRMRSWAKYVYERFE
ncbi:MAG TPA: asparagine synthase (glutamine-hydrolyzing) [Thermoanaerobaculia bacterium]|jgi:asparagine synthase (glutamine-hydrolysing)